MVGSVWLCDLAKKERSVLLYSVTEKKLRVRVWQCFLAYRLDYNVGKNLGDSELGSALAWLRILALGRGLGFGLRTGFSLF